MRNWLVIVPCLMGLLWGIPAMAQYGASRIGMVGDFDGNGVVDYGWYDRSTFEWTIVYNGDPFTAQSWHWGCAPCGDVGRVFDVFQDGKLAIGVYRYAGDQWFWLQPATGRMRQCAYGACVDFE